MSRVLQALGFALVIGIFGLGAIAQAQRPSTRPRPAPSEPVAPDKLQADTVWKGTENGDPRVVNPRQNVTVYAEATILTRNGEEFTFEYWIFLNGVRHGLELRGQIRKGEVRGQPTKILPGGVWDDNIMETVWAGTLEDDTLKLERPLKNNQIIKISLKLDPTAQPAPRGGRGGRGGRAGRRG